MSHEIRERKSTVTMEVNEHFEHLSLTYPYLGLGVQDDFCIQLGGVSFCWGRGVLSPLTEALSPQKA